MTRLLTPLLVLVLLAVTVSANIEITDGLEDNGDLLLEVDYSKFDEEDEELITETTDSFTVTNNGAVEETVTVSVEGLPADYQVAEKQVTIAAGASKQITVDVQVPHEKNPGKTSIGTIQLEASNTVTVPLIQNTLSMLSLREITIEYIDEDGKDRSDDFDSSSTKSFSLDNEVKPGTEMVLTIEVENLFDNKDYDESELEKIELEIDADDNDIFPDDFEDTYDFSDIKADKKDSITVRFTIPQDANGGDYTLEFTLTGEDGKDVEYEIKREVSFELKREKDDVRFTRATVSPITIAACVGNTYTVNLEIQNFGTDDQDHTVVTLENSELGISENSPDFTLEEFDEDDTWRRSFTYTFPAGITAKTYGIDANVFIDLDETQDFQRIDLVVETCGTERTTTRPNTTEQPTTERTAAPSTPPATAPSVEPAAQQPSTNTNAVTGATVTSVEDPYTVEDLFIGGIIVGTVLVVVMIGLFFMILLRK